MEEDNPYKVTPYQRIQPLLLSVQGKLKNAWPTINRWINDCMYFLVRLVRGIIKIAREQMRV